MDKEEKQELAKDLLSEMAKIKKTMEKSFATTKQNYYPLELSFLLLEASIKKIVEDGEKNIPRDLVNSVGINCMTYINISRHNDKIFPFELGEKIEILIKKMIELDMVDVLSPTLDTDYIDTLTDEIATREYEFDANENDLIDSIDEALLLYDLINAEYDFDTDPKEQDNLKIYEKDFAEDLLDFYLSLSTELSFIHTGENTSISDYVAETGMSLKTELKKLANNFSGNDKRIAIDNYELIDTIMGKVFENGFVKNSQTHIMKNDFADKEYDLNLQRRSLAECVLEVTKRNIFGKEVPEDVNEFTTELNTHLKNIVGEQISKIPDSFARRGYALADKLEKKSDPLGDDIRTTLDMLFDFELLGSPRTVPLKNSNTELGR